jgi:NADH-quinone oxidoreductase subunit N
MMSAALLGTLSGPHIEFAGLSPLIALLGGAVVVLLAGVLPPFESPRGRLLPAALALGSIAAALGLTIWQWHAQRSLVAGALRIDPLAVLADLILLIGGAGALLLAARSHAGRSRSGAELYALLLSCLAGMFVLVGAQNTVILFLGFELLSIPLYVLCAIERERERSLEAGLKYLIIGSVGGATLLYGLALIYGVSGQTAFAGIARAISSRGLETNAMLLGGVALVMVGFAFKASVAPFHQWTPDVYEGAPTPITAFMAVATKVAALSALLRFFDVALIGAQPTWGPGLAVLAAVSIIVGNVGALGQTSMKRLLAWSAVGQAGYMLAGVVVSTRLGVRATLLYLAAYMFMNLAAFAVVIARERESDLGDSLAGLRGLAASRPLLAWPMTLAMLGLAGIPATVGFVGKFYLIDAAASNGYTWLGVVIVIGSMISLGYYLPVVAAMWMRSETGEQSAEGLRAALAPTGEGGGEGALPAIAGAQEAPVADRARPAARRGNPEVILVALLAGAATLFFGIIPGPLFDLVSGAGRGLGIF